MTMIPAFLCAPEIPASDKEDSKTKATPKIDKKSFDQSINNEDSKTNATPKNNQSIHQSIHQEDSKTKTTPKAHEEILQ